MNRRLGLLGIAGFFLLASGTVSAQDKMLRTIGALGASNLYMTYVSIGTVADGHVKKSYDDNAAENLLSSISQFALGVNKSLQELLDSEQLTEADTVFVVEMQDTLSILVNQSDDFQKYIDTGDEEHARSYKSNRKEAWSRIEALLGGE